MPYLTKSEIKKHRAWLANWRKPEAMLRYSEELMEHMASDTLGISSALFNQGGADFITEAHAAATFASLRGADAVRLVPDDRPDFQVRMIGVDENWEFTEADVKGRERGREYHADAARAAAGISLVEDDPVEEWHARADQVPSALHDRAAKKASKNYPVGTRLLIYLNIDEHGIRQQEIEACMAAATAPAKGAFAEVWVLWKSKGYRLWVQGKPSTSQ